MLSKSIYKCKVALTLFLWALFPNAQAEVPEISIKGIELGMPESQLIDQFGAEGDGSLLKIKGFTIGGVESKYLNGGLSLFLDDGRLGMASLTFDSDGFDNVLEAVREKYPKLKCSNSKVKTNAGADHVQTMCKLKSPRGELNLIRYLSTIDTSDLELVSNYRIKARADHSKKRRADI